MQKEKLRKTRRPLNHESLKKALAAKAKTKEESMHEEIRKESKVWKGSKGSRTFPLIHLTLRIPAEAPTKSHP